MIKNTVNIISSTEHSTLLQQGILPCTVERNWIKATKDTTDERNKSENTSDQKSNAVPMNVGPKNP